MREMRLGLVVAMVVLVGLSLQSAIADSEVTGRLWGERK